MDEMQEPLFTTVKLEDFVPADHPLRPVRQLVNEALKQLNGLFSVIYADSGRASIAPEKLLRALLLQVLYSVRSERMLMEQMRYNLLFRWFVGLAIEDAVWDHSTFSKNRDRLLEHEVVEAFFTKVMGLAEQRGLLSREHFSVDGTLIQAWASHKSFRPKDGPGDEPPAGGARNADTDWRGQRRSNETHQSSTDPDARLFRKSKQSGAILAYQGHILMENRSGLVVGAVVSHADGFAERASALRLLDCVPGRHAKTLGADKGYDMRDFVGDCRARKVTPHVARNDTRQGGSAIDGRTSRHAGYRISQVIRKRIEEHFGWGKTVGRIRQTVYRGIRRVDQHFKLTMLASNLTRMARILTVVSPRVAQ
ncbi:MULTISPECIES: IS5 family transposase [Burkholderia]|uniref:IS5 family transposase n=1 Tax=Burkholderia TaxID=32008 RepID=UPI000327FDC9|nr:MULTISPECIES: IS5 family transposase [Burkholderia]AGK50226.1 transposase DDE domain protein [Burkholderia thailandensis MSMB121]ATF34053.1 IS5 family transposase [Burkholderia thailandensis]